MDVARRVFGMAIIYGAIVILLILLNRRDRRALRLRATVLDQLALPELRGRVGVHIQCAVFSRRRAVIVDLLGGTPHEVWNVFTRLVSRLPPRVRLVVHDTPDSGFIRPFALETTIGRPPLTRPARRSSLVGMAPMALCPASMAGLSDRASRGSRCRDAMPREAVKIMGGKVMTRILVPTDFSELSLAAVRSGMELATTVGGVALLLHVVGRPSVRCYAVGRASPFLRDMNDPGGEYCRAAFDQQLIRHDFCEEARWKLDALVPPGYQARVRTMVTVGRAAAEIVRVAEEQHADLILLGGRVRRGWRHVFRRTMADRVRRKTFIPVVTLDADDFRWVRDSRRRGVPVQRLRSGRAAPRSAELVGMVQDMDGSRRLLRVESPAPRREVAHDAHELPVRPHAAGRGEPDGRHAQRRLPTSHV